MMGRTQSTAWALLLIAALVIFYTPTVQADDQTLFETLYNKISDLVTPDFDEDSFPTEVVLMEMPGIAIRREDYDTDVWRANEYSDRMPDALVHELVDRLPAYTGSTFVDSGSTISRIWDHFMHQYLIPVLDDEEQRMKVEEAKLLLANDTLLNAFEEKLDAYDDELGQYELEREECLGSKDARVCAKRATVWRERLKRKWFAMEVTRRDLANAEATIIAYQVQDIKNIFADALERFESSRRIDMGAGQDTDYFLTTLTPSDWWKWWPIDGANYDYQVAYPNSINFMIDASATILSAPEHGAYTYDNTTGMVVYTPDVGYTGGDVLGWTSAMQMEQPQYESIAVLGSVPSSADTAFVKVTATSTESSTTFKSSYRRLHASASASFRFGFVRASGSFDHSSYSSRSSFTSETSTSSMAFELAKVRITRPWLDTSLLSFSPVGIRGIRKAQWSDGTIYPAQLADFRFKLLPTAMLVARNVEISNSEWGSTRDMIIESQSTSISAKVSVGPFFTGKTKTSWGSGSRDFHQTSSFDGDTLSIPGPQIIGWVCTPVPIFPTASEAEVKAYSDETKATLSRLRSVTLPTRAP